MEQEVDLSLPCLICMEDIPSPHEDDIAILQNTRKLKDDPVFQSFLKLFKVKDFQGNDEPDTTFKFCGTCKHHLGNLLELKIKLDDIKKQIKIGVENLQGKIDSSEGTFKSEDIYESYPRYKTIRSQIVDKDSQKGSTSTPKAPPKRVKRKVPITRKQELALKSILKIGPPQLNWPPPSLTPEVHRLQPPEPRKYLRFIEYPEKQLLLYGDFTFNLLTSASGKNEQVNCTLCNVIIPYTKGCVKSHVLKVHTDTHVCPQCSMKFSRAGDLKNHISSVHEGGSKIRSMIICKICQKPICSSQRKKHEWSHKSKAEKEQALKDPSLAAEIPQSFRFEKKIQCDKCDEKFAILSYLKKHQDRKHRETEERMELCPECGNSYLNLKLHLKTIHAKEDKDEVVDLMKTCLEPGCGKKFLCLGDLTRHKNLVHKKLRPFECPDCGKCFGDKWNLRQHEKSHTLNIKVVKIKKEKE